MNNKFLIKTIIISIIGFLLVNLIAMKIGSPSDGNDIIGIPLEFYEYRGGKREDGLNREIFNIGNFLIDFGAVVAVSIIILLLIKKSKSPKK